MQQTIGRSYEIEMRRKIDCLCYISHGETSKKRERSDYLGYNSPGEL